MWDAADGAVVDSPAGGDLDDDMCDQVEFIYEADLLGHRNFPPVYLRIYIFLR